MTAPSAWQIEQVMSIAQATAARLLDDAPDLADDETALLDALRSEGIEVDTLLRRIIRAALEAESYAVAADKRVAEIRSRRDRFLRNAEALRGAAFAAMDALGLRQIKDAEFSATIQPGRVGVVITDEAALPDRLFRIKREPNKTDIAEALKNGEVIDGAEMRNGAPTLTIRRT